LRLKKLAGSVLTIQSFEDALEILAKITRTGNERQLILLPDSNPEDPYLIFKIIYTGLIGVRWSKLVGTHFDSSDDLIVLDEDFPVGLENLIKNMFLSFVKNSNDIIIGISNSPYEFHQSVNLYYYFLVSMSFENSLDRGITLETVKRVFPRADVVRPLAGIFFYHISA